MRGLLVGLVILSACTDNVKDERVNATGTANSILVGTGSGDANPGNGTTPPPAAGDPNAALAEFLPVSYNPELDTEVKRLCTGTCHTGAPAQGTPLLNSAAALKAASAGAIAAINGGRMPLGVANLSVTDKKYLAQLSISLKNWAKNNTFATEYAEFNITYDTAISTIAQALCVRCHSGETPPAGVLLETQEQWKTAMPRILRAVETGIMPPKVDGVQGPRLLRLFTEWQNKGFP